MAIYGYARVSTGEQNLATQLDQLGAAGVDQIIEEKQSGKSRDDRERLAQLLGQLSADDVVMVTRLDRLGRRTRDVLEILDEIHATGAKFRSLAETWADTTTPQGALMVTVFAGFAQFEREMILEKTARGRELAQRNGVRFGRPKALSAKQVEAALEMAEVKGQRHTAEVFGVSVATIKRLKAAARIRALQ